MKRKRVPVICLGCKTEFMVKPSRIEIGEGKYCDYKCFNAYKKSIPDEERFWAMVEKTDNCWPWKGYIKGNGYGQFSRNGNVRYAHRFSYELHFGGIPEEMVVCHKCDNPLCVNPDHLFIGTQQDNMDDMKRKGRNIKKRLPKPVHVV